VAVSESVAGVAGEYTTSLLRLRRIEQKERENRESRESPATSANLPHYAATKTENTTSRLLYTEASAGANRVKKRRVLPAPGGGEAVPYGWGHEIFVHLRGKLRVVEREVEKIGRVVGSARKVAGVYEFSEGDGGRRRDG
jgi:hypothetical protein